MGNYKEGFLEIPLKNNTPLSIIEPFIILQNYETDKFLQDGKTSKDARISKYLKYLKDMGNKTAYSCGLDKNKENLIVLMKSLFLDRVIVEVHFNILLPWCNEFFEIDDIGYVAYCDYMHSKLDKTMENFDKVYGMYSDDRAKITYRKVHSAFKSREFSNVVIRVRICSKQYDNEFDKIVEYLRPYIDSDDVIGKIKDEDGWLNKKFFKDSREDVDLAVMKYSCVGCPSYNEGVNCDEFINCQRAFVNGINLGLRNKGKAEQLVSQIKSNKLR